MHTYVFRSAQPEINNNLQQRVQQFQYYCDLLRKEIALSGRQMICSEVII